MPEQTTSHQLEKGDILFTEGDESDFIYYILQGSLEIYTYSDQQRITLGQTHSDEYVGELGVLQNTSRNATAIALETTYMEKLNLSSFVNRISQDSQKSLKLLHSLSYRTRNIAVLSEQVAKQIAEHKHKLSLNPLHSLLTLVSRGLMFIKKQIYKKEQARYQDILPIKRKNGIYQIKKGQALFHEGQESHYACRIIGGEFKATKSLHNSYTNINTMSAGEFIGEIGLLEGGLRSLTIIALSNAEVEVFDEEKFLQHVSQNPEVSIELIKTLSYRASALNLHLKDLSKKHAAILNPSTLRQTKQLLQNIGDLSNLTGQMLEQDLHKLQTALKLEAAAVQDMLEIYYRYINGEATQEEMEQANADFRNFLKTLGLGALIIIPGSFITIPIIVKMAKSLGIDILPKIRS